MIFGLSITRRKSGAALAAVIFAAAQASAETLNTASAAVAPVAAVPMALPNAGASFVRVCGALMLVLAVFLGGIWLFKNWQRLAVKKSGGAKLNLIEVKSLGQRQAIYVVGYQQQRMLLASSPAGVTLLSHLPAAEETETTGAAPNLSFSEALQHVLSRRP